MDVLSYWCRGEELRREDSEMVAFLVVAGMCWWVGFCGFAMYRVTVATMEM